MNTPWNYFKFNRMENLMKTPHKGDHYLQCLDLNIRLRIRKRFNKPNINQVIVNVDIKLEEVTDKLLLC